MLCRIIYTSQSRCDDRQTAALVRAARIANARQEVTGALYASEGKFAQYLEGEEEIVDTLYERIRQDPRHSDCQLVDRRTMFLRVYTEWSMAFLPDSSSASLMMRTLLSQSDGRKHDGALMGAFFYAMARTGECQ